MSLDKFREFVDHFENSLKIMTISPHLEAANNYQRMKYLLEKNITVSLGVS
jgi:N-acetylglucosamine-6-phosphate deacetylase